jgi:hypothetical protein
MTLLPWNERITAISINPEMAKISDIVRLADELMQCRSELLRLSEVVGAEDYNSIMILLDDKAV